MDHLHSQTHTAAARSQKKIDLLPEDQVFHFSHRHIGLRLSVSNDKIEFPAQDSPFALISSTAILMPLIAASEYM